MTLRRVKDHIRKINRVEVEFQLGLTVIFNAESYSFLNIDNAISHFDAVFKVVGQVLKNDVLMEGIARNQNSRNLIRVQESLNTNRPLFGSGCFRNKLDFERVVGFRSKSIARLF